MSFEIERVAILERFVSQWDDSAYPIEYPNTKFNQPDQDPWCRLSILRAGTIPASVGTTMKRTNSLVVLQCFQREDQGTKATTAMGDAMAAMLDHLTLTVSGGCIVFQTTSIITIGVKDGWFQENAQIQYRHDKITS
jgi:hypothetical protein